MKKKVVVAAAIRNAASIILPIFNNLKIFNELFDDVIFIFIESNSSDDTLEQIKKYKSVLNGKIIIYSFGNNMNAIPNRMQRICKARNYYLDIVEKDYYNYDYLYVLDFNDTNLEPYNAEVIMSNFNLNVDWDMICANQEPVYYDLYALRHETWMPFNCWNAIGSRPDFMSYKDAHNMFVKSRFINIDKNELPIKVVSAFGGSAFIKISSIKGARHSALDEKGEEECEWVPFCKQLDNVYINPKFINMTKPNRHYLIAMSQ